MRDAPSPASNAGENSVDGRVPKCFHQVLCAGTVIAGRMAQWRRWTLGYSTGTRPNSSSTREHCSGSPGETGPEGAMRAARDPFCSGLGFTIEHLIFLYYYMVSNLRI